LIFQEVKGFSNLINIRLPKEREPLLLSNLIFIESSCSKSEIEFVQNNYAIIISILNCMFSNSYHPNESYHIIAEGSGYFVVNRCCFSRKREFRVKKSSEFSHKMIDSIEFDQCYLITRLLKINIPIIGNISEDEMINDYWFK
jgi:hypothetical protein